MKVYARVIEVKRPISGDIMGIRFIAGLEASVVMKDCLFWYGDFVDPGMKEVAEFEVLLRDFPYHADKIIWRI